MSTKSLLLELLVSGFFAIACFRARAGNGGPVAARPWEMLRLKDRLQRLSMTRWQWFAVVLLVLLVRVQSHVPLIIEMTLALQFVIFLALPTEKKKPTAEPQRLRRGNPPASWAARQAGGGKV
jgi:hypothetical protein